MQAHQQPGSYYFKVHIFITSDLARIIKEKSKEIFEPWSLKSQIEIPAVAKPGLIKIGKDAKRK